MGTWYDLFIFVLVATLSNLGFTVLWIGLNKSMLRVFSRLKDCISKLDSMPRTILNYGINLGVILLGAYLWDKFSISDILAALILGMLISLVHFLFKLEEAS